MGIQKLKIMNIRTLIIICMVFLPIITLAEDIIVMNNGDIIKSKVIEIGQIEVKYKKVSNLDGPTYSISKSEILSITYDNGETDKFGKTTNEIQTNDNSQDSSISSIIPDGANSELIRQYNEQYPTKRGKSPNNKIVEDGITYWGFTDESILSTNDIEVRFKKRGSTDKKMLIRSDDWDNEYENNEIIISIFNKTKEVIYIDLANTFKVCSYNGNSEGATWYDPTVFGSNKSSSNGATLGLGAVSSALGIDGMFGTLANGIGIGLGNSNSTNVTTQMERIIAIPPMSEVPLPPKKNVVGKNIISKYEDFRISEEKIKNKLSIRKYELKKFTYDETLFKRDYYITFSKTPTFNPYFTIPIHLYVRAIYGCSFWEEVSVKDFIVENPDKLLLHKISMYK